MKKMMVFAILALFISGCATALDPNYSPVVDFKKGQSSANYQKDLAECKALAAKRMSAVKAGALGAGAGAALGAGIGALMGAIFDVDVGRVAAAGAVAGGVSGVGAGVSADINQKDIITRCLSGRGYAVIGK